MPKQTRNTNPGIPVQATQGVPVARGDATLVAWTDETPVSQRLATSEGVGARHAGVPPLAEGGGYLSSCSASGAPLGAAPPAAGDQLVERDPRIEELRLMGVRPLWVKVADRVGFEAFIEVWRTLSDNQELLDERNRITVPTFLTYHWFQRNQVIRSLAGEGLRPSEISERMTRVHKRQVSTAVVRRTLRRMGR